MLNFCVSILIATFLLLFPHGADRVFVGRPCQCVFFPFFSLLFLIPLNKSRLFSQTLLRVRVWIPSQIIPEWLEEECLGYLMAGQQKGPRAALLVFSLFRLDHILVMGRTINGHALMPKAPPPLLSVHPDGSLSGDVLMKIAPLICWPSFLPPQANDRLVYLL